MAATTQSQLEVHSRIESSHNLTLSSNDDPSSGPNNEKPKKTTYSLSFWLVFASLCFTGLISALDGSIVSTALPSIIAELDGGANYIWVVNVYFLTR